MLDSTQLSTLRIIYLIGGIFSLTSTLFIIFSFLLIKDIRKRQLMHLVFFMAICDFFFTLKFFVPSVGNTLSIGETEGSSGNNNNNNNGNSPSSSPLSTLCVYEYITHQFFGLGSISWYFCITLNAYLALLTHIIPPSYTFLSKLTALIHSPILTFCYHIFVWSLSLGTTVWGYSQQYYGYTDDGTCWISPYYQYYRLLLIVPLLVYFTIALLLMVLVLYHRGMIYNNSNLTSSSHHIFTRIMIFITLFILSWLPTLFLRLYELYRYTQYHDNNETEDNCPFSLIVIHSFSLSFQGFINMSVWITLPVYDTVYLYFYKKVKWGVVLWCWYHPLTWKTRRRREKMIQNDYLIENIWNINGEDLDTYYQSHYRVGSPTGHPNNNPNNRNNRFSSSSLEGHQQGMIGLYRNDMMGTSSRSTTPDGRGGNQEEEEENENIMRNNCNTNMSINSGEYAYNSKTIGGEGRRRSFDSHNGDIHHGSYSPPTYNPHINSMEHHHHLTTQHIDIANHHQNQNHPNHLYVDESSSLPPQSLPPPSSSSSSPSFSHDGSASSSAHSSHHHTAQSSPDIHNHYNGSNGMMNIDPLLQSSTIPPNSSSRPSRSRSSATRPRSLHASRGLLHANKGEIDEERERFRLSSALIEAESGNINVNMMMNNNSSNISYNMNTGMGESPVMGMGVGGQRGSLANGNNNNNNIGNDNGNKGGPHHMI